MKLNFQCIAHLGLLAIALGMREIESSLGFERIFYSFVSKFGAMEFGDKDITFNMNGNTWTIQHLPVINMKMRRLICDYGINCGRNKWVGNCINESFLDALQLLIVSYQSCHTSTQTCHVARVQTAGL